jgi:hypothetical protein
MLADRAVQCPGSESAMVVNLKAARRSGKQVCRLGAASCQPPVRLRVGTVARPGGLGESQAVTECACDQAGTHRDPDRDGLQVGTAGVPNPSHCLVYFINIFESI